MFISKKTVKGNVGYSNISQEAADKQAQDMDDNNCTNCNNCKDCIYCTNCCNNTGCSWCINCNGCINCDNCDNCKYCKGWKQEADNLMSLHGLYWPVIISETHMKIGCQFHSHERWKAFPDKIMSLMDNKALEFWTAHKDTLLALCEAKAKTKPAE